METPLFLALVNVPERHSSSSLRPVAETPPKFLLKLQSPLRPETPAYSERALQLGASAHLDHSHSSRLESMAGFAETPFVQQARVPVASLSGGRVQLAGFYRTRVMENVLMGLPGAGSLPAWGISLQSHSGIRVPRAEHSYGFSLSLRLAAN